MSYQLKEEYKKPMRTMLIALGILFGGIFLYKSAMNLFMKFWFAENGSPAVTVSTLKADYAPWEPKISAAGSTRAVTGVNVTAQLSGMVQQIYFTPGTTVTKDTVLVQQNADPDIAKLHALEANMQLAKITYERDKAQYKIHAVSKQQLDTDEQNYKSAQAQVAQQAATVDMKSIRAPFTGRLGISKVNPGQYLNPGDTVVTLQTLDPIYVDFYVPQQALASLKLDQRVVVTSDTFPGKLFTGKVTTINPLVDTDTRNVEVEATIDNPDYELTPGMFTHVEVTIADAKKYLTLPQSAITFNSYGDIVYIIREQGKDKHGKPILIAKQSFVTTGETRGDQITILNGLKAGDLVVTSGQLKLKNGSHVNINNDVQPTNQPNPTVSNEHQG